MGILNVTPDSFSDGGCFVDIESALAHALQMEAEGAAILDIGGESTRPGAESVTLKEELERTIPLIEAIRERSDITISIDTSKAAVAEAALNAGAAIVNDVTGLEGDPEMPSVCAKYGCGVVVMHMQGRPRMMQNSPQYTDVLREVLQYFQSRYDALLKAGVMPEALCFDPGIGFGKTDTHNLTLLKYLDQLRCHDRPLMLGVSRKSVIGRSLNNEAMSLRDWPTVALTALGALRGAEIHRVHQIQSNVEALKMIQAIKDAK